jgi:hypothetical protein
MTEPGDIDSIVYEISRAELHRLPTTQRIAPNVVAHNTTSEREAHNIIAQAANRDERIVIYGHDSESDLMIPFLTNPGHEHGASASYVQEQISGGSLSDYLKDVASSGIGEVGDIDFFQIQVYEK